MNEMIQCTSADHSHFANAIGLASFPNVGRQSRVTQRSLMLASMRAATSRLLSRVANSTHDWHEACLRFLRGRGAKHSGDKKTSEEGTFIGARGYVVVGVVGSPSVNTSDAWPSRRDDRAGDWPCCAMAVLEGRHLSAISASSEQIKCQQHCVHHTQAAAASLIASVASNCALQNGQPSHLRSVVHIDVAMRYHFSQCSSHQFQGRESVRVALASHFSALDVRPVSGRQTSEARFSGSAAATGRSTSTKQASPIAA